MTSLTRFNFGASFGGQFLIESAELLHNLGAFVKEIPKITG